MSRVYIGIDSTLHKQWAIKEIKDVHDERTRDVIVASLRAEADLLRRCDHPAIPRIVDLIEEGDDLYVVKDYAAGVTVEEKVSIEGPQDEEQVVDLVMQLCDVLDYLHCHSTPMLHLDIKPSNIIIKSNGALQIIDFGTARMMPEGVASGPSFVSRNASNATADNRFELLYGIPSAHADGSLVNSVGYSAPECYMPDGRLDTRSDVYSVSAVAFYALTGTHPSLVCPPARHIRPEISEGMEKVVAMGLEADPNNRPPDCGVFAHLIRNYRTQDELSRKKLQYQWRTFLSMCVAFVLCVALGVSSHLVASHLRTNEFETLMDRAHAASTVDEKYQEYRRAAQIRPENIEPYMQLLDLYVEDGTFTQLELSDFETLFNEHRDDLRSDENSWASLNYKVGETIWYFYKSDEDTAEADAWNDRFSQAYQWMIVPAQIVNFEYADNASLYIALIDSRKDVILKETGYAKYFEQLEHMLSFVSQNSNCSDAMRVRTAQLVLLVLMERIDMFYLDGVTQDDMRSLASDAVVLSKTANKQNLTMKEKQVANDVAGELSEQVEQKISTCESLGE
ncbi:MAG: serine/threonine protein kinase [Actinomycetaceae bacterium]|nr:serine/threonine protein kinase [Actinomycetaceae bacterium]